jgi:hypothetical protein
VSSARNSTLLSGTFPTPPPLCPAAQTGQGCRNFSNPVLRNNIIWQNRSFQAGISAAGTGTQNQQNIVTLYNASFAGGVGGAAPAQGTTGACTTGSYWDIGVRGDTGPTNHSGGTLTPFWSVLSSGDYTGAGSNNSSTAPPVVSQYCNGSRVPPECLSADGCGGPKGFGVPPGIADAVTPNPLFSFTPSATVDEGNNWINVSWGPLSLTNPAVVGPANPAASGGDYGGGPALANYNLTAAIDTIPANQLHPFMDFYGNLRPEPGDSTGGSGRFDPGAIEFGSSMGSVAAAQFIVSPSTLSFGPQALNTSSAPQTVTVTNTGTVALAGGTFATTGAGFTGSGCTAKLAVGASCTYSVTFRPTHLSPPYSGMVTVAYTGATGSGTPVSLSGSGVNAGQLVFTTATHGTLVGGAGARTLIFTIPTLRAPVTSVVTIRNNGLAGSTPVTITGETVAGNLNSLFSLTGTTCVAPLAPGASCTISIQYATPTVPGTPNTGVASVTNNGSGTSNGNTNLNLVAR